MTDKVLKALECCSNWNITKCFECPYVDYDGSCVNQSKIDAIALIKEQQEKLKRQANNIHTLIKMDDVQVRRIKAEAIKEFAEKLKTKVDVWEDEEFYFQYVTTKDIDELVKEMVGADND